MYGLNLFCYTSKDLCDFPFSILHSWRRVLGVGGRAPSDVIDVLLRSVPIEIDDRVQRLSLFLRPVNSPGQSWQYAALVFHSLHESPWCKATLGDLHLILPCIRLKVVDGSVGVFVMSTGWWSEEHGWYSAKPLPFRPIGLGTNTVPVFRS